MSKMVLTMFCLLLAFTAEASTVSYKMIWSHKKLPIEIKTVRAPLTESSRVGEHGIVKPEINLPMAGVLEKDTIKLGNSERAVLYLFVKNKGKKKLKFSVAPHSTEPGAAALGFHFNCLCNGHVYEVGPDEVWYRVMILKTSLQEPGSEVILDHEIFEVTSQLGKKPQAHLHHK